MKSLLFILILFVNVNLFGQQIFSISNKSNKIGLTNDNGKVIAKTEFDKITKAGSNEFVCKNGNLLSVILDNGKIIVPLKFTELRIDYCNNQELFPAKNEFGWTIFNRKGKTISKTKFENVSIPNTSNQIVVLINNEYRLLDNKGKVIQKQLTKKEVSKFSFSDECWESEFSLVDALQSGKTSKINDKYGYIKDGDTIVNPIYDELYLTASNYWIGRKDIDMGGFSKFKYYGIITKEGVELTKFEYGRISTLNNYAILYKDGLCGVYSIKEEKLIIPIIYTKIRFIE